MKNKWMLIFGIAFLVFFALSLNCSAQTVHNLSLNSDQMGDLLKLAKDLIITFQFYHNSSNALTLYAWPKRKDRDDNEDSDGIILTVNEQVDDLAGKNVLLASFRLGKKKDRFKKLSDAYYNQHYAYYQFRASIEPVESSGVGSGVGLHVCYEIWGADKDSELISTAAVRITNTKNPSPPR